MSDKKDKWYVPEEFKDMKNKGATQIVRGVVIAIAGLFNPNQGGFFVVGGIIWAIVGICLVAAKSTEQQETEENDQKEEEVEEESDNEVEAEMKDLSIKILLEENRKLVDKVEKLEQKAKENE